MLFLDDDFSVKILAVLCLDWQQNNVTVSPRSYNALSFRVVGNAEFSNGESICPALDHDLLFIPTGVGYHVTSGYEKIIVIHFELSGIKQNYFEVITPDNTEALQELFLSAYEAWNSKKTGYYFRTVSIFYRILEQIVRQQVCSYTPFSYDKIETALRYMHEHFTDSELSVSRLCQISNMSDTYFRRLFSEVYKTTPNHYLADLRLSYAEDLLSSGYYSVEQTALKSGFSDPKYFSKVFKKRRGCSPSVYMKAL